MEKSTAIEKITFRSPLNLDRSFGCTPLSSDAESTMELYYYTDNTGFIEWIVEEFDIVETIGLIFEITPDGRRALTDYDGVFDLPTQAMDLLEKNGVDVSQMRQTLAD